MTNVCANICTTGRKTKRQGGRDRKREIGGRRDREMETQRQGEAERWGDIDTNRERNHQGKKRDGNKGKIETTKET